MCMRSRTLTRTHLPPPPPHTRTHTQGLFYLVGPQPNPFGGLFDFYVAGPLTKAASGQLRARDFALREK